MPELTPKERLAVIYAYSLLMGRPGNIAADVRDQLQALIARHDPHTHTQPR